MLVGARNRVAIAAKLRRAGEEAWRPMSAVAGILWRPCRCGGERPYFVCPRCSEPVLHLYVHSDAFSCRTCQRLTYGSRREREPDRLFHRANRLRRSLGGEAGQSHMAAGQQDRFFDGPVGSRNFRARLFEYVVEGTFGPKQHTYAIALGGEGGAASDVPPRRKHTRHAAYWRTVEQIQELEAAGFSTFAALLRRIDRRSIVRGPRRPRRGFWEGTA